jgi:hypothetical protein
MIPEDKILVFDIAKIPAEMSTEEFLKYLESLEHPELVEGCILIDKVTDETGL